jgi:hypothetical protein
VTGSFPKQKRRSKHIRDKASPERAIARSTLKQRHGDTEDTEVAQRRNEDCSSDEANILDLRLENFFSTLECQQILSTFLAEQAVDLFEAEGCRRFIINCD